MLDLITDSNYPCYLRHFCTFSTLTTKSNKIWCCQSAKDSRSAPKLFVEPTWMK